MEALLTSRAAHPSAEAGGHTALAMADALRQVADGLTCSVLTALDPDWRP